MITKPPLYMFTFNKMRTHHSLYIKLTHIQAQPEINKWYHCGPKRERFVVDIKQLRSYASSLHVSASWLICKQLRSYRMNANRSSINTFSIFLIFKSFYKLHYRLCKSCLEQPSDDSQLLCLKIIVIQINVRQY
mgnify:CR=1 FL=1